MAQTPRNIVKGPYLIYKGDNTNMIVMWQLDGTSDGVLSWGLTTDYLIGEQVVTEDSSDTNRHIFSYEITSLRPETLYYYKVYSGNVEYTSSFKSGPRLNESCRLLIHSDTHADRPDDFEKCMDTIMTKIDCDSNYKVASLHGGDFIVSTQTEATWNSAYFGRSNTRAVALQSQIPIIPCRGNHDSSTLLRKYFPMNYSDGTACYYAFDYGNARIIILDLYATYTIGSTQHDWMLGELASTKLYKIVLIHDGPYHVEGHHDEVAAIATNLSSYFEQYGAIVFCGHNHHYSRCIVNDIIYINTSSTGGLLYTCTADSGTGIVKYESGWNFVMLYLGNDGYEINIIRPRDQNINNTQDYYQTSYDGTSIEDLVEHYKYKSIIGASKSVIKSINGISNVKKFNNLYC